MNKEEKDIIKEMIKERQEEINRVEDYVNTGLEEEELQALQNALNYIDKLEKENETQKEAIKEYEDMITHYNQSQKIYSKIKDKIKEIEYIKQFTLNVQPSEKGYEYCINVLKELLGE